MGKKARKKGKKPRRGKKICDAEGIVIYDDGTIEIVDKGVRARIWWAHFAHFCAQLHRLCKRAIRNADEIEACDIDNPVDCGPLIDGSDCGPEAIFDGSSCGPDVGEICDPEDKKKKKKKKNK